MATFVGRLLDVSPCVDRMRGASYLRDDEIVLLLGAVGAGSGRYNPTHIIGMHVKLASVQKGLYLDVGAIVYRV